MAGRWTRPDPYNGSLIVGNPQSFNRYSYVGNDPVNFGDPTGLYEGCVHEAMTKFLATLAGGKAAENADELGRFAGDKPGGADSPKYAATSFFNAAKGFVGLGPSARIHFASESRLAKEIGRFDGYLNSGNLQQAGFVLHSIEDVHGAHQDYHIPFGHFFAGHTPDRIIGDAKFLRAANEVYQLLSGKNSSLTDQNINDLIDAIIKGCGKKADKLDITRPTPTSGGGGGGFDGGGYIGGGGYPSWWYSLWSFVNWVNSIPVYQDVRIL